MFASNVTHTNQRAIGFLVALTVLLTPLLSTASGNVRAAPAYTEVGGPIVSDTTWTLANSPYIVVANVEVWQGVTLTIQPGVVIKFQDGKLLQVNGTLVARGTESQRIVFTSAKASPRQGDWGSIYFTDSSVDATFDIGGSYISGSVLQYCTAEYAGQNAESVIHAPSAAPYLDHCMVRNNSSRGIKATGTADHHVIITSNVVSGNSAYFGGGISADNSTVTGNTVSGNSATSGFLGGGGIYAYNSTVTGNTVSGNSASYDGGGIYASRSTVTGNTVSGNSASHDGGGIYASDSTVTGNTVSGNSTPHYGGGIFADNSTVAGNTVSGNSTSYLGGGIYASKGTVTSNTVSGNSASNGGGIDADNSTVTGNTVSGNSASNGGGIDAGSSTLTGNIVSGNSASYGGGGISAGGSTVTGNTVSGNSTYWGGGGGISVVNSTVASNTVSGNSARNDSGGGIYAYNSTVISNTITANRVSAATGQGSGVYFDGSDDFLYNVIVGNTAISPTAVIGGVAINGTPQFHHNNLYGNSNYDVVVLSSGDISGTHNYWGAVATVDILAHVYDWYDNSSRGRLLFIPYIQDPDPNAPVPPPQNLRATFAGGSASLSWDAIPSTTTGYGYKVYYDTDASGPPYHGAGATQGNSPIDVGNATHFTLSGFGSGGIVVTITAYDTQGRESWYSNEVHSPWRNYLPAVLKR